jgi:hypothetical protein
MLGLLDGAVGDRLGLMDGAKEVVGEMLGLFDGANVVGEMLGLLDGA